MNEMLAGLTKAAHYLVLKMKDRVSANNLPNKISEAMSIGNANIFGESDAGIEITISLDPETGAPMAGAYEWGSGIHDPENPHLIPIAAKNASNLVFWWERESKWFVGPKLPYGHPGVAPRPYIEPTIRDEMEAIKSIVGTEVKAAIITSLREINV